MWLDANEYKKGTSVSLEMPLIALEAG